MRFFYHDKNYVSMITCCTLSYWKWNSEINSFLTYKNKISLYNNDDIKMDCKSKTSVLFKTSYSSVVAHLDCGNMRQTINEDSVRRKSIEEKERSSLRHEI